MKNRNDMSEVGYAEDLIRSYVQFGCAEIHAMTLYYKTLAQLENGIIEASDTVLDKLQLFKEDIDNYSDMRRRIMRKLYDIFEGDKDMWCQAKHLAIGAMTLFEAYEGSGDEELLVMAYEANKEFVKAMTRFLGIEITDCASCLSDFLKGVKE